jgi:hypothetical protein
VGGCSSCLFGNVGVLGNRWNLGKSFLSCLCNANFVLVEFLSPNSVINMELKLVFPIIEFGFSFS